MFRIGAISAKLRLIPSRCLSVIAPIFFLFSTAQAVDLPGLIAPFHTYTAGYTCGYNGPLSGLEAAFKACNPGTTYTTQIVFSGTSQQLQYTYTGLGYWAAAAIVDYFTCPAGYLLASDNSACTPDPAAVFNLPASTTACTPSTSLSALTPEQLSALNWLTANQSSLSASVGVFDPINGAGFFAFGFAGVLILFFSSHIIGLVLKQVKHG